MNRHPVNLRGGQKCFLMVFHAILNYCFCAIFRISFLSGLCFQLYIPALYVPALYVPALYVPAHIHSFVKSLQVLRKGSDYDQGRPSHRGSTGAVSNLERQADQQYQQFAASRLIFHPTCLLWVYESQIATKRERVKPDLSGT